MKKIITLSILGVMLVGCATRPQPPAPVSTVQPQATQAYTGTVYKIRNYDGPEAMEPEEVTQASRQCIINRMHPHVTYLSVRTEGGKLRVPVSVVCEPY